MGESVSKGARALAVLLIGGGVVGIGIVLWFGYQLVQTSPASAVIMLVLGALFVWSALTGIRLWRGDPRGWKWAIILFAAQIPVLTVSGFSYEYYTGLQLKLVGGDVDGALAFNFGALANFYVGTEASGTIYGVNLVAIAALAWLLLRRPRPVDETAEAQRQSPDAIKGAQ